MSVHESDVRRALSSHGVQPSRVELVKIGEVRNGYYSWNNLREVALEEYYHHGCRACSSQECEMFAFYVCLSGNAGRFAHFAFITAGCSLECVVADALSLIV